MTELYDSSWYAKATSEEVEYYRALLSRGPALEVGVGTGRLAIPLLDAGVDLYGIDNSADMHARLRQKLEAHGRAHDVTRFIEWGAVNTPYPCPDATFSGAIVPFASFSLIHSNLVSSLDENRLLRELNRVLRVGGVVVVNDYRLQPFDVRLLKEPLIFNHDHHHPVHGAVLEEQKSICRLITTRVVPKQPIRYRRSRLIRKADGFVLRERAEETPLWDPITFPLIGCDAGLAYVGGEVVHFHADPTISHVFEKVREL